MTEHADNALVLMERAVASRDPLELALAGFLSAYKGRTFDKQRRVIKHFNAKAEQARRHGRSDDQDWTGLQTVLDSLLRTLAASPATA